MRTATIIKRILPQSIVLAIQKIRFTNRMRLGTSTYEVEMKVIKQLIRNGDIVLDVGASLGWYTRYLSDLVGEQGQVISIEPVPNNYKILSHMLKKLQIENVNAIHCALSDSESMATIYVPFSNFKEPITYLAHIVDVTPSESGCLVEISTTTVDNLVRDKLDRVRFIKCDVEGHELSVLKGAETVLSQCKPAWLLEVWGDPDDTPSQAKRTFDFIESFDYTAFIFDGWTLHQRRKGEKSANSNYFFLTKNHLEMVKDFLPSS